MNFSPRRPLPLRAPRPGESLAVIGVLNVTPDSFSDGGRFAGLDDALAAAQQMVADGADLIDVGGESTRPGAQRVALECELDRVIPVIRELTNRGIATSVDTMRGAVAAAALAAGASVVNDVSGGLGDIEMGRVLRETGAPWILMHWRGHSTEMSRLASYEDVVSDVISELRHRVEDALAAGVSESQLILDPGLGFAKTAEHNWQILAQLDRIVALGLPVLVGASRKSFLGRLLGDGTVPRPVGERESATVAITTYSALHGAWGVRVHEVRASVDAARTVAAIQGAGWQI